MLQCNVEFKLESIWTGGIHVDFFFQRHLEIEIGLGHNEIKDHHHGNDRQNGTGRGVHAEFGRYGRMGIQISQSLFQNHAEWEANVLYRSAQLHVAIHRQ